MTRIQRQLVSSKSVSTYISFTPCMVNLDLSIECHKFLNVEDKGGYNFMNLTVIG